MYTKLIVTNRRLGIFLTNAYQSPGQVLKFLLMYSAEIQCIPSAFAFPNEKKKKESISTHYNHGCIEKDFQKERK